MEKLKAVNQRRNGVPIVLYVPDELKENLKIVGGGAIARGARHFFLTYEKEIKAAAKKALEKTP